MVSSIVIRVNEVVGKIKQYWMFISHKDFIIGLLVTCIRTTH